MPDNIQVTRPCTVILVSLVESILKTTNFGINPAYILVFNNPDLKVGATDLVIFEGFRPNDYLFYTFLDRTLSCF